MTQETIELFVTGMVSPLRLSRTEPDLMNPDLSGNLPPLKLSDPERELIVRLYGSSGQMRTYEEAIARLNRGSYRPEKEE